MCFGQTFGMHSEAGETIYCTNCLQSPGWKLSPIWNGSSSTAFDLLAFHSQHGNCNVNGVIGQIIAFKCGPSCIIQYFAWLNCWSVACIIAAAVCSFLCTYRCCGADIVGVDRPPRTSEYIDKSSVRSAISMRPFNRFIYPIIITTMDSPLWTDKANYDACTWRQGEGERDESVHVIVDH